jgi:LacI family transcriptional regulator
MVVQSRLQEEGYGLVVGYTLDDKKQQHGILGAMAEQRVDGVILLPAPGSRMADLQMLRGPGTPLVLIGRRVDGLDADFVSTDNPSAARQLGEHLVSLGVRRAALLGGGAATSSFVDRFDGLTRGLGDAGSVGAYPTAATFEGGVAAARQLLDSEPATDAIVAYTDTVALGIYEELRRRGIRPGADIAIATFDDSVVTRLLDPPLTTIATFPHNIGGETVSLLLSRLQSPGAPARTVTVAPELHLAASTTLWRRRSS